MIHDSACLGTRSDASMMHAGVPRVFDRIHNGVITKLEEKGGLAAKLFHWGYSIKSKKLRKNVRQDKVRFMPCVR